MDALKPASFENDEDVLENPILFWKKQLDFNTPLLQIPADFHRPSTSSGRMDFVPFLLSATISHALKQLSRQHDTTLSTTLFTAYNALLFRYTNRESIVIGYPGFENIMYETGALASPFRTTKVFRTDLSGNPGFNELVKRVHQVVLTGNSHKSVQYERLEKTMKLELGIKYTGLYNVLFSFRNTKFEKNEFTSWSKNIGVPESSRDTIDLALYAEETINGINGIWTYNSDLFAAATIERLAKHFEVLLESIVSNPQQSISQLRMLTDEEHHQLTQEWNNSAINYPANKCIHELFEEQAEKTPGAIALVFEDKRLSYAELNGRANQLARYLIGRGVTKETLVPLCIGRSLEMIIGILGILKAGGAYVPIDPNYPLERIAYMLEDTKASVVICNKDSKTQLGTLRDIELVELDAEYAILKNSHTDNLSTAISSANLAYVIYTSGSTGKPKGVMIEHRELADHCYGLIESAGLKSCASFALFSPLVFDAGHAIIHSSFILGASLHVLSEEVILNSEKVAAYLENNIIDCIKIVPSLWLSYANLQKIVLSKKVMIFGGEAFHLGILNYLTKLNYGGNVYNHYGPTEVTIGKCIYKVDLNRTYRTVPIGKPFSNTQLYILDDHFQLTPAGIEGELYVAGDGVARGYLNQPGLTAEKFIPNPFTASSSSRMYKTGDKVRWLHDGNIEYLGRADEQVKIQGHRIELGEIEDAILQSGSARQAIVLAITDKRNNKRLVAYVVSAQSFNKEAITAFLRRSLPEYMIPVTFIELDSLPLTKNGKIDKKELESIAEKSKPYIAPRDETEADLAMMWQDLLKIDRISVDDDFFELGGNSLQVIILLTKVKKRFHKNFPLAFMFRARTIQQFALELKEKAAPVINSSSLVPIQPNGLKTPVFGVHAGLGDILFYESLSEHLGLDQPFYGIQAKGLNGMEHPSTEMRQMASYYISEIRKVQPEGPYYLVGYCLGARIIFEMAQQLTSQGQKIALLANFNGISPAYRHYEINTSKNKISQNVIAGTSFDLKDITQKTKRKVSYTLSRIKRLFLKYVVGPLYALWILICGLIFKFFLLSKQKAPVSVARLHVSRMLRKIQNNYKPKPYQGSMIIFRSPGIYGDPYLGWDSFVKGKIKTFDIPGDHKSRRDVMNEPFVQFLAKDLENFLDR